MKWIDRAAKFIIIMSITTYISLIFYIFPIINEHLNILSGLKVSARSMRLRCMETLMSTMNDNEIREAAGEERREDIRTEEKRGKKWREKKTKE